MVWDVWGEREEREGKKKEAPLYSGQRSAILPLYHLCIIHLSRPYTTATLAWWRACISLEGSWLLGVCRLYSLDFDDHPSGACSQRETGYKKQAVHCLGVCCNLEGGPPGVVRSLLVGWWHGQWRKRTEALEGCCCAVTSWKCLACPCLSLPNLPREEPEDRREEEPPGTYKRRQRVRGIFHAAGDLTLKMAYYSSLREKKSPQTEDNPTRLQHLHAI